MSAAIADDFFFSLIVNADSRSKLVAPDLFVCSIAYQESVCIFSGARCREVAFVFGDSVELRKTVRPCV